MSSEIHKLFREQFPTVHRLQETNLGDIHNLKYVEWLETSFQSLRLSHEETTKQLRALEDAIRWNVEGNSDKCVFDIILQAIQNSRARKQG